MDDERLVVLRLLEQGKITAEEAAELLQALDAGKAPPVGPAAAPAQPPAAAAAAAASPASAVRVSLLEGIERLLDSLAGVLGETRRYETVVEGSFSPGRRPVRVVLHSFNGRIQVCGWERPTYRLELVKEVRARTEEAARRLAEAMGRVTRGDEFLAVESERRGPGGMKVTCWLPQDLSCELEARSSNGRIVVEGITAQRMRLATTNDRVEVSGGRLGDADIETSNGRIVVAGPAERVRARTSNDRIDVIPPGGVAAGTWDLETSNARVTVALAAGTPVRLDLATRNAPIRLSVDPLIYEINEKGHHSRVVAATPGGGPGTGVQLRVRTSNDVIRVEAVGTGD